MFEQMKHVDFNECEVFIATSVQSEMIFGLWIKNRYSMFRYSPCVSIGVSIHQKKYIFTQVDLNSASVACCIDFCQKKRRQTLSSHHDDCEYL